jgi:PTS hybrid protein
MVGLVLVSNSAKLAEGLADLVAGIQPDLPVRAAGGTDDGRLGTSAEKIHAALCALDGNEGTLILLDLGSAVMSTEVALEWLTDEQRARVRMSDAPLVEGAVLAAINAGLGLSLDALTAAIEESRQFPKNVPAASGRSG